MQRRHFFNYSNLSGISQNQNGYVSRENSYYPRGSNAGPGSSSLVYLMDNFSGVQYADFQINTRSRQTECFSSSFRMEAPPFRPTALAPPYDLFSHSTAASNLSLIPENYALQFGHRYHLTNHETDPMTSTQRMSLKRKSSSVMGASESGITSRYHGIGGFSYSSYMPPEAPMTYYQHTPAMPISFPQYRNTSCSITGGDALRNVRRCHRPDFRLNAVRAHPNHSTFNPYPTFHSGTMGALHSQATMPRWNVVPFSISAAGGGRIPNLDISGSSQQTYWPNLGHGTSEIGVYPGNFMSSQLLNRSSHDINRGLVQDAMGNHINYSSGVVPFHHREMSYPHTERGAALLNIHHSCSQSFSSQFRKPLSGGRRWSISRHDRSVTSSKRIEAVPGMVDDERIPSQSRITEDHSSDSSSSSSFSSSSSSSSSSSNSTDEFTDMRLDIDSMSYEELLALGERIGHVCTGLSEDMILTCLTAIKYSFSAQNKGNSCAICLEVYKKEDEIGSIKKCGHDYHLSCIKKWLLMKNFCPVCKCAAYGA